MKGYCVVVADAAHARFFTLGAAPVQASESGPKLMEDACLVNPEKELPERAIFSDVKSGINRSSSGQAHGYDDHRSRHEAAFERRFAKQIAATALKIARQKGSACLLIVAESRMLGYLRREFGGMEFKGITIRESERLMTRMPVRRIQTHLAKQGLLPACQPPQTR
jgi:protein required for attachment to host cells